MKTSGESHFPLFDLKKNDKLGKMDAIAEYK